MRTCCQCNAHTDIPLAAAKCKIEMIIDDLKSYIELLTSFFWLNFSSKTQGRKPNLASIASCKKSMRSERLSSGNSTRMELFAKELLIKELEQFTRTIKEAFALWQKVNAQGNENGTTQWIWFFCKRLSHRIRGYRDQLIATLDCFAHPSSNLSLRKYINMIWFMNMTIFVYAIPNRKQWVPMKSPTPRPVQTQSLAASRCDALHDPIPFDRSSDSHQSPNAICDKRALKADKENTMKIWIG